MDCLVGLREWRFTSFDHTLVGKCSSAGRLTRNATSLFDQVCAGRRINATRPETFRRVLLLATCDAFLIFPTAGFKASSGIDLDTHVPAPTNVSRYPSACNCSYALETGIRDIFNSAARFLVDGTLWPGRNWPARIAC